MVHGSLKSFKSRSGRGRQTNDSRKCLRVPIPTKSDIRIRNEREDFYDLISDLLWSFFYFLKGHFCFLTLI